MSGMHHELEGVMLMMHDYSLAYREAARQPHYIFRQPKACALIRNLADPDPPDARECPRCGRVLRVGDWPFCKGVPEAHSR